jgi:hypothetical protein
MLLLALAPAGPDIAERPAAAANATPDVVSSTPPVRRVTAAGRACVKRM